MKLRMLAVLAALLCLPSALSAQGAGSRGRRGCRGYPSRSLRANPPVDHSIYVTYVSQRTYEARAKWWRRSVGRALDSVTE